MAGQEASLQKISDQLSDWRWRLNNLYSIINEDGKRVPFRMNWAQEALFDGMHYMNVILKARQLGFTTFIQVFMLDACVFNRDIRAGTIAHTLSDAQIIFRDKVKYPYDSLPDQIKAAVAIKHSNATELMLTNNSSIRVGTSLRSGTLQYLHISEYGKMCAKFPEKAREVRTGALNTVQAGQLVFMESTAEGQEGDFFDTCEIAQTKGRMGVTLTPLDWKFHFYPWWKADKYQIDPAGVVVTDQDAKYFAKLAENSDIVLNDRQKAWYVKKSESQKGDMKREYPSTAAEAFEASIEGAYFADQMAAMEAEERIGPFEHVKGYPVDTTSDIGMDDVNSVWLFQVLPGRVRCLGYFEHEGTGMDGMIGELERRQEANGYTYGTHFMPHDIRVREWTRGGATRIEIMLQECKARDLGTVKKVERAHIPDRISATRRLLGKLEIDQAGCAQGIKCLKSYRKDWDEDLAVWKDKPRHDWASHGADALGGLALAFTELAPEPIVEKPRSLGVGPHSTTTMTMNDAWLTTSQQSGRL